MDIRGLLNNYLFTYCIYLSFFIFNCFNIHAEIPKTIHIIGDSHSREFKKIPNCSVHWIGPITMHRIGRDGFSILHLPKFGIKENEAVVFSFGEIDARCHIGKQRDTLGRNIDEIIETLVTKYLHTILNNRLLYKQLLCIVYSATPPTDIAYNPRFPYYGTIQDRVEITKKLNARLATLCAQVGIEFLDVYNDYANQDGTLKVAYSDGNVHIHQAHNQAIANKLQQIINRYK